MTPIVNLMANDIWSDADITNRTESMIRMEFSVMEEQILNRKVTGQAMGMYTMTPEEQASLARYAEVCEVSRLAGVQARQDMALLLKVFPVEQAMQRLQAPPVEPEMDADGNVLNGPELIRDAEERAEAEATINAADAETMALVQARNPQPSEL